MNSNSLLEQVSEAIGTHSTPLWFPDLTDKFVEVGEKILRQDLGIPLSQYGTNRIWCKDAKFPCNIVTEIFSPFTNNSNSIRIELLDKKIIDDYEEAKIGFYDSEEIVNTSVIDCLREAVDIINIVPSLLKTVFSLVRSLHLIKLDNDDYDVSFSEPHIPFSIFVSIPCTKTNFAAFRVAEAITHEAMHLQLTLFERVTPLVTDSGKKYFSPWKEEYRNSGGVLHALYVFRTLDSFFENLLDYESFSTIERNYLLNRRKTITRQIVDIQNFVNSPDLTNLGKYFTKRLLTL